MWQNRRVRASDASGRQGSADLLIQAVGAISLGLLAVVVLLAGPRALIPGQEPSIASSTLAVTETNVVHVLGFESIRRGVRGTLTVQGDALQFSAGTAKAEVSIGSIQDLFTGQDNKQLFQGTAGTVAKLAVPYGGGRVLSLFHQKVDVLTLEYQDSNGGFHGAIFTLSKGRAPVVKRLLVDRGAHASIPPEKPQEREKP